MYFIMCLFLLIGSPMSENTHEQFMQIPPYLPFLPDDQSDHDGRQPVDQAILIWASTAPNNDGLVARSFLAYSRALYRGYEYLIVPPWTEDVFRLTGGQLW